MAEYVYIQNYNKQGIMGISYHVFDQITAIATNEVRGATLTTKKSRFSLSRPVKCSIKNGTVTVSIALTVSPDANVSEVATEVQANVATSLKEMTELIPFNISVEVKNVG